MIVANPSSTYLHFESLESMFKTGLYISSLIMQLFFLWHGESRIYFHDGSVHQ